MEENIKDLYVEQLNIGQQEYEKEEYKSALDCFKKALEYAKQIPTAQNEPLLQSAKKSIIASLKKLSDIYLEQKSFEYAFYYLKETIDYNHNDSLAYFKLGICLKEFGKFDTAVKCLKMALEISPDYIEPDRLIADIYRTNLNKPLEAIKHYNNFIKKAENSKVLGHVYNILGSLYESTNQYEDIDLQIKCFEKSLELLPDFNCALKNLSFIYPRAGRYQEALDAFHKLIETDAATVEDYVLYGTLQIQLKNFEEGWKYYEYRFQDTEKFDMYPNIDAPVWKGEEITDKTLLVHYEQGYGDSIMFFRYINQLKPLAKKIILRVQNNFVDLFELNSEGIEVVGMEKPVEILDFDYHISLMSLIHTLHSTVNDIPSSEGYIKADKEKTAKYKKEFFNNDKFKIGIAWNGSKSGRKERNIPLKHFYPLTNLNNVQVYSFQKGVREIDLEVMPEDVNIVNLGKTFEDFSDTAAALENLDLFITSDNGVFNLAGAMGKKTFVLLNKESEWRWFLDEEKTPWYDSVRIFKKQYEKENWEIIMQKIITIISEKNLIK